MPPKSARSWRRRPTRGGHTRSCALCTGRTKRPPSCVFRAEPTAVCACGAQGFLCPWTAGPGKRAGKKGRGGNKQQQGRGGNNQQTEQGRTGKTGRPGNAASEWKWVLRRPGWCKDTRCKDDFGRALALPPGENRNGHKKKDQKRTGKPSFGKSTHVKIQIPEDWDMESCGPPSCSCFRL